MLEIRLILYFVALKDSMMQHPIICFEGPSGVGKTSLARRFKNDLKIIPEVNLLFERSGNEGEYWYLERQLERFEMCKKAEKPSILDGDIFQPIWYNWVTNYPEAFLDKEKTYEFYFDRLQSQEIAFPDLYIIFNASEEELRKRKEGDRSRQRRNFEMHLKIVQPLQLYWNFLAQETDVPILFVDYWDIKETYGMCKEVINNAKISKIEQSETFKLITNWIDKSIPMID